MLACVHVHNACDKRNCRINFDFKVKLYVLRVLVQVFPNPMYANAHINLAFIESTI